MKRHDLKCTSCGYGFTVFVASVSDAKCPKCGGRDVAAGVAAAPAVRHGAMPSIARPAAAPQTTAVTVAAQPAGSGDC